MPASFVLFVCAGFLLSLSNGLESRGTRKPAQVADKTEKRNVTDQKTLDVLGNNKASFQYYKQTKMLMSQMQLQQSQMQLQQSQMQLQQSQIQSLQSESQNLKILIQSMMSTQRNSSVTPLESSGSKGTGNYTVSETVYVRWGSQSCPNGTAKVYSGVVGGGEFTATGAAVNTLCLPLHPVHSSNPLPSAYTFLYGSEYEVHPELQADDDVLCAVCLAPRSAVVMVPATNTCPTGWTVEYKGYLMAGHHNHAASTEYICMDMAMEGRYGSKANENGKLFYYVVGQCGSLPCPPYNNRNALFCVVCTKLP